MDTARLFQSGHSQTVRRPKAYRFAATEVVFKPFGNGVLLLPADNPGKPCNLGSMRLNPASLSPARSLKNSNAQPSKRAQRSTPDRDRRAHLHRYLRMHPLQVTNYTREFAKGPGLLLDSWVAAT